MSVPILGQSFLHAAQADVSQWATVGQFKAALFTGPTPPDPTALAFTSLTGELPTDYGYTRGGQDVSSFSPSIVEYSALGSWPLGWASGATYGLGAIVTTTVSGASQCLFQCCTPGTASGSSPSQANVGQLDTSSVGAQFINVGSSIIVLQSSPIYWLASVSDIANAWFMVLYDVINNINLVSFDMGAAQNAGPGNRITNNPDSNYGWYWALPR
jgi:hypothetical protein